MTENQVLEAIREYAKGMELSEPENGIIEMKLPGTKTDRRYFIQYEVNKAGSAWITFKFVVGQILEPKACIDLLFMKKWQGSNYYFYAQKMGDFRYLFAETFVHLHEDMTVKQAADIMFRVAMLPMFEPTWPSGFDNFD
jgi:hypothetical protein